MIPLSVLDLAPITDGSDAATALRRSLDLARHAERLGYRRYALTDVTSIAMVGSAATVAAGLKAFVAETGPNEVMVVSHIYDHGARVRSYEIAAQAGAEL
jgi:alkanesulfonate monooxygenase SsuD/methylene tetrahydromethanopterin reductase-like flavin-dependent oxidoreductase (luciferase family)